MNNPLLPDPTLAFPDRAPKRVISLVPSVTGSMIDLGLGGALAGCSDFCVLDGALAGTVERVGGPKTIDVEKIRGLVPDLVIANREENSREGVMALADAGITVWLTFPVTVVESINDLWTMARLFRSESAMQQVDMLERAMEWARHAAESTNPLRYFCPIWQDMLPDGTLWWMTFNRRTYSDDLLEVFRGENIFGDRERHYPLAADLGRNEELAGSKPAGSKPADSKSEGERDTRYPRVTLEEITAAQPELILLPSEPYPFTEEEAGTLMELLVDTPAVQAGRVYLLDGSLITWPGTRMARALDELSAVMGI